MVDRIVAPAQRASPASRDRNERLHVGRVYLDADSGRKLARSQHAPHLLALRDRHYVRGRRILGYMLITGQHPGDLPEIDAMLLLQDAAPTPQS